MARSVPEEMKTFMGSRYRSKFSHCTNSFLAGILQAQSWWMELIFTKHQFEVFTLVKAWLLEPSRPNPELREAWENMWDSIEVRDNFMHLRLYHDLFILIDRRMRFAEPARA